ncbi:unnamed protein product [Gongylonema pulchrum]|uniref:Cnd3 domain-containing protein n=1 Tax=Gongylonema pulchrum TaxID=637853 RepID=A0A183D2W8_9BILA|nr:unnamed protein product [Gongylonema pulchrum]
MKDPHPQIWPELCEMIGVGVQIDATTASNRIYLLRSALEVDAPSCIKEIALKAIAGCIATYTCEATARMVYSEIDNNRMKTNALLKLFEEYVTDTDDKLCTAAVSGICRMLNQGLHMFPSALCCCLLRYFDQACPPRAYAKLKNFFDLYPTSDE